MIDLGGQPMTACCELCLGNVPEGAPLCPRCELPFLAGKAAGLIEADTKAAKQRARVTVLRREVRRLNAKVAAYSAVVNAWRGGGFDAVQSLRDARVLSGSHMWSLRQALNLTACEVSNEDVIRAAARRLGKREEK